MTTRFESLDAGQPLDMLTDAACKGGNLVLNVGPTAEGEIPPEFVERSTQIGTWLNTHGQAIYGSELTPCDLRESNLLGGRQLRRGNSPYIILRFWHGGPEIRLAGLDGDITHATLLGSAATLTATHDTYGITLQAWASARGSGFNV